MNKKTNLSLLRALLILCWVSFLPSLSQAQVQKIDSLEKVLKTQTQQDTTQVKTMSQLGFLYWSSNPVRGEELSRKALELSKELNYTQGLYTSYRGLGASYFAMSKYAHALEAFLSSLRVAEEMNDNSKISSAYGGIGVVYFLQKSYPKALEYYKKADSVNVKYNGLYGEGRARTQSNMGEAYMLLEQYDSALVCIQRSIDIAKKRGEPVAGDALSILADVYTRKGNYAEAMTVLEEALVVMKKEGNKINMISALYRKAKLFAKLGKRHHAYKSLEQGIQVAEEAHSKDQKSDGYLLYHDFLLEEKKYKEALDYYHKFKVINDEVYNEKSSRQLEQYQAQHEMERKQQEFALNEQKLQLQQAQLDRQQYVMLSLGAGIFFVFVLAIVLYKNNRTKRRTNLALVEQKKVLHQQQQELMVQTEELHQLNEEVCTQRDNLSNINEDLKEYNQRVTDSISAAQIIQEALLPFDTRVNETFSNHFIIYRPKDIVSGDFYWMTKTKDCTYLAVIDCTGHGVPGALTSILAYSLLNESEELSNDKSPAAILTLLYDKVRRVLSYTQRGDKQDIGMDVALCRFDYQSDGGCKLTFAGAKRPLHFVKNNRLQKFQGTRLSIGSVKDIDEKKQFENYTTTLNKGDVVYLTTDGYVDTCDENLKKIGTPKFEEIIESCHQVSMQEQAEIFNDVLDKHQGEGSQRDDITVIGVRV